MAPTNGKLEARIRVPSAGYVFELDDTGAGGPFTVTVEDGDYYWSSASTGGAAFATYLQTILNASGTARTYTVTLSAAEGGTGKLAIAVNTGTYDITWTSTTLRDLCGFTGNISAQTTSTGSSQVQGLWLPDCPHNSPYGGADGGWVETDGVVTISPGGGHKGYLYSALTYNALEWQAVLAAKARTSAETTTNASFQTFWSDGIRAAAAWATVGGPIRFYNSASTDGTYLTYGVCDLSEHRPPRREESWAGMYAITLPRLLKRSS